MNEHKGIMPTKIELTLEQSQQGVSNDVLSAEKERKKAFVVIFPLSPSIAKGFFWFSIPLWRGLNFAWWEGLHDSHLLVQQRKRKGADSQLEDAAKLLHSMDSSIDELDLGSLSHRRTKLEVEREGNIKGSPSLCLLLAVFLVYPGQRRLQIQLQDFFPILNSSPARFELRVVGRPSRFASSRPAKSEGERTASWRTLQNRVIDL
nr:hypothetical protein [Tanacetum cinerariifolium]